MSTLLKPLCARMAALLTLLVLLASCDAMHEDYPDEAQAAGNANSFINLTITVSTANEARTRAGELPNGGENGDGREAGFVRENNVKGITLILYQNAAGIKGDGASTTIDYVHYFPVYADSRVQSGTTDTGKFDEAVYSTGDRSIEGTKIDVSKNYHAIIVANRDLNKEIEAGTTTLGAVRDLLISTDSLYTGLGLGTDAEKFIMSSETDAELRFPNNKESTSNGIYYRFSNLRIERLAARIDFSAAYPHTLDETDYKGASYDATKFVKPGYVYPVYKTTDADGKPTSKDRFVVTAVVPFNLNGASEYLIKRVTGNGYLGDETTDFPWVLDPQTTDGKKTDAHPAGMTSTLTSLVTLGPANISTSDSYLSMASLQTGKYSVDGADNLIVAYPMENALGTDTKLYYYATGLAIEGYYYQDGNPSKTPARYVFYGYLRHQGESATAYPAYEADDLDKTAKLTATYMNYAVVRNNIYRVSIDKITEKGYLLLKVKKYDPFIHDWIYM